MEVFSMDPTEVIDPMTTFLTNLGSIVTSISSQVATWIEVITDEGNEILLFSMLLPLVFIGIRALKLLLGQRV